MPLHVNSVQAFTYGHTWQISKKYGAEINVSSLFAAITTVAVFHMSQRASSSSVSKTLH